jgi:Cd2+/Zn2+-exporting ATPase
MTALNERTRFRVDGMDCGGCASKVDRAVRRIDGVADVSVSVTAGTMTVEHASGAALGPTIIERVGSLGYRVRPFEEEAPAPDTCNHGHDATDGDHDHDDHGHDHADDHGHDHAPIDGPLLATPQARLAIASGSAIALAWVLTHFLPQWQSAFFGVALLFGLVPIARHAFAAARAGTPFSIEMLMTTSAVGAAVIGALEEATMVVFLFQIGELLEGLAANRARAGIRALSALVPKTAFLVEDGATREIPAERLAVGATILVRPGDRLPADGTILTGTSAIDESPVTGESVPVTKGPDDDVFAGTINGDAGLTVAVTAAAADNTIARVIRMVEEAQEKKAPTERFIDRFARYYTPCVALAGLLVAVLPPLVAGASWHEWIYKGLALLLIGCPCALVISTPAAIAASLSAGARRGLLVKGGAVLENVGRVSAVAFDKTGTLTEGRPDVTDVLPLDLSETEVLRLAAALETGSSHPLAKATLGRAAASGVAIPEARELGAIGGKGVTGQVEGADLFLGSPQAAAERVSIDAATAARLAALNAEGKTVSVLIAGDRLAGALAYSDEPRADAVAALAALKARGIRTVMLTGDHRATAEAIGRRLGIEVWAELLPADKQRIVGELKAEGFTVAKVGDGINDAPALAAADVGVAMGGGTDVALETADAAILHGRVGDVAALIDLSRRTMANIRENIVLALGLKGVFLVTTIAGITGLWPAILADTGATVLVTANALRLLRRAA